MAIGISWNIDIPRSLNSRDIFPRRKFENRSPTSYRPGLILSPPTISFELRAKTAEEIDLEKCNFRKFWSSVTLTLALDRVKVALVHITYPGEFYPHTKLDRNKKTFRGRTDERTHLSSNLLSPGADLIKIRSNNAVLWRQFAPQRQHYIHRVSKNFPPLTCYNFDAREWILIFFGEMLPIK